jgi:hypothetical protein
MSSLRSNQEISADVTKVLAQLEPDKTSGKVDIDRTYTWTRARAFAGDWNVTLTESTYDGQETWDVYFQTGFTFKTDQSDPGQSSVAAQARDKLLWLIKELDAMYVKIGE